MRQFDIAGGVAGLVASATYLFGFGLLFAVLLPAGYRSGLIDAAGQIAFLEANTMIHAAWIMVIFVLNSVALTVLALAIHRRIKDESPLLAQTGTTFALVWVGLILASGMLTNIGTDAVLGLNESDPLAAEALLRAVTTVQNGLGGGNEIAGGIWVLLISLAAWRAGAFSNVLNALGLVIGLAGLTTTLPAAEPYAGPFFGLGFILWFAWVGIALLLPNRDQPVARAPYAAA